MKAQQENYYTRRWNKFLRLLRPNITIYTIQQLINWPRKDGDHESRKTI